MPMKDNRFSLTLLLPTLLQRPRRLPTAILVCLGLAVTPATHGLEGQDKDAAADGKRGVRQVDFQPLEQKPAKAPANGDEVSRHEPMAVPDNITVTAVKGLDNPSGGIGQTNTTVALGSLFEGANEKLPGTPNVPDANLAVGPGTDGFIVETFNRGIQVFDKYGNDHGFMPFTGSPGIFSDSPGDLIFDPRILYDSETGLFILVALQTLPFGATSANGMSWIWLAVANDPTATWTSWATTSQTTSQTAANVHPDQISLGLDREAVYVSVNLLTFPVQPPNLIGIRYRVFDKQSIIALAPQLVWNEIDTPWTADGPWTMRAAHILDPPSSQPPVGLFVGAYQGSGNDRLRIVKIKDPLLQSSTQLQLTSFDLQVPPYDAPTVDAPQGMGTQTCDATLDVLSGQLINAVWSNGFLYTAHAVDKRLESRNVVRWYQIQTSWPSVPAWWSQLAQTGEIDPGPSRHGFMPSVGVNFNDEMSVVYAVAEEGQGVAVHVTGRAPCDPPGAVGMNILLRSSNSCYTAGADRANGIPARWGDYFGVALDPDDNETFWVVGEVAEQSLWTTYIAPLTVVPDCGHCECLNPNN